ncbi:MAG TPA: hypothetical protein VET27_04690 [Mycobacterium sp.]|nr:hypothetical protein [Mycobacterium sp.]
MTTTRWRDDVPAFLRRMFGVGKLPEELRSQLESEGVTISA